MRHGAAMPQEARATVLEQRAGTNDEIHGLSCDRAIAHAEDARSGLHDDHCTRARFHDHLECARIAAAEARPECQNLNDCTPILQRERPDNFEWGRHVRVG